jgi:hypothetical protein
MAFGVLGTNSWGVPTSVTRRVYFESDAGMSTPATYVDDVSFGQTFVGPADVGDFAPSTPTWQGQAYYDHADYILEALAMGSPNAVTVVSSQATNSLVAYSHIIDVAPNTNGRAITIATDKVNIVEELTSAKVAGWGLAVGTGGVMMKRISLIGAKSTLASTVNTRSAVAASAVAPALANRVFRAQGVLRLNTQAAGSLSASDNQEVEDISLEFTRPLAPATVFAQNYTIEPLDDGFPTVTLSVRYPRANTVSVNSLYAAHQAGTAFKGSWTFTGLNINSTTTRSLALEFPHLEPVQPPDHAAQGAGQLRSAMVFRAKQATAAPTGFSHTRPFRLTRVTSQSLVAF